jgi:hypothetical protein
MKVGESATEVISAIVTDDSLVYSIELFAPQRPQILVQPGPRA